MVTLDDDRSAALVIRVWLEGDPHEFRGRVTASGTSPEPGPRKEVTVAVASSPREVLNAVSEWLEAFQASAEQAIDNQ
jgi:hypothetical protein